jgi:23S rRNA (uracil1939-C5)-methyltransferase
LMKKTKQVPTELIRLNIEKLDSQGDGFGRDTAGKIVFVGGVLPGETVLVRKTTEKKDFATARLVKIELPHPERVVPFCPWHERCGGCQLQHASHPLQLRLKLQILEDAFSRIGRVLPIEGIASVCPSPLQDGYRNKISLPVSGTGTSSGIEIGYFQKRTHRIIPIDRCPVAMPDLNLLLAEMRTGLAKAGLSPYNELSRQGFLRHVVLRGGQETGELLIVLVVRRFPDAPVMKNLTALARRVRRRFPGLVGLALNLNPTDGNAIFGPLTKCVSGRSYFFERFGDFTLKFEATSFAQVNTKQAVRLYETVAREACPLGRENVLELYAGVGAMTCFLAAKASRVLAVEEWKPSAESMRENLMRNGFNNTRTIEGAAEDSDYETEGTFDTVVIDPPRSGCHPDVLKTISNLASSRIVYVSCNPSTLARDVKLLCQEGAYRLIKVIPFDLFPQTSHVESVTVLERALSS